MRIEMQVAPCYLIIIFVCDAWNSMLYLTLKQLKLNIINMKSRAMSKTTLDALKVLGQLIRVARGQRRFTQGNLAIRLRVTRQTIMNIEKGDPTVSVGTVFEAAYILDIPLFIPDNSTLTQWESILTGFSGLLPKKTRVKKRIIDNDF